MHVFGKEQDLNDAELLRYARQILLSDWDDAAQLKLKAARVLVVGLGGLGCPLATTLVRAGVGHLHLFDHDDIDPSNLQRQTLFLDADVDQSKAKVAAKRLIDMNPWAQVTAHAKAFTPYDRPLTDIATNTEAFFDLPHFDLLLDCSDNFATRDQINQFAVETQTPVLSAAAIGYQGQLALFEPQKGQGCYRCVFTDTADDASQANCINSGVLASTTAVMGNLQAHAALMYLGRGVNVLASKLFIWDGLRFELKPLTYQPDPNCNVCGDKRNLKYKGA